ncbi:MAG: NUDIX domain-containing protein [Bacteroidetes bacterium]|nr:NUDIX domain-containing protein [Bacteroidota bacterium]
MTSMNTSKNSLIYSYGIIPIYKNSDGKSEYLVVRNHGGFWGFPKGKPENNEKPVQSAVREAYEETGITVSDSELKSSIEYSYIMTSGQKKIVTLFPVYVESRNVKLQNKELQNFKWASLDEALELIDIDGLKNQLKDL